ncbi:unnamed protein product, partial [Urochloa humidicola]
EPLAARVTGFVADARSSGAVGSRAAGGLVGARSGRWPGGLVDTSQSWLVHP